MLTKTLVKRLSIITLLLLLSSAVSAFAHTVIRTGAPVRVVFLSPIPLSQLGTAQAPEIPRGHYYEVRVQVQDEFGVAVVDTVISVSIVSDKPDVGDVGAPGDINTKTVNTDSETGIATFVAWVTKGRTDDTFDMTASINNGAKDIGRLRLGRAIDRLGIFYSDTTASGYDPSAGIIGIVGDWFKVTVKVLANDTVHTTQTSANVVRVFPGDDGLVFSATSGGEVATEFPLNNGVATFWLSATKEVIGCCIDVEALVSSGGAVDGGVASGNRCKINLRSSFTLRYHADSGGRLIGATSQLVNVGSDGTTVVALADAGYVFSGWSDGVTTSDRTDRNVTSDINVTATFTFNGIKFTLRYELGVGGREIIGTPLQTILPGGNGQEIYALAETGYTFARWSDGSTDNPRTDTNIQSNITVTAYFANSEGNISVKSFDRVIPLVYPSEAVEVIVPLPALIAEFTVGPNPAGKSSGSVSFFRKGNHIVSAKLSVYDASGNIIKKITIHDNATNSNNVKRMVGSWDLRDAKGHAVPTGTYLVKGVLEASGCIRERVSLIVSVR